VRNLLPNGISKKRRSAVTVVTLAACLISTAPAVFGQSTDPLHTLIPVHLDAATGNIQVGSTTYKGGNPGFHVLALSRQPDNNHLDSPDLVSDNTYQSTGSITGALETMLSQVPDPLLIINAVQGYQGAVSDIAQELQKFGEYDSLQPVTSGPPFIFIGIGGGAPKTALQRGFSTNNVDGYLAPDSNGNYAFIRTDFVRYDITTDGTVKIGGATYATSSVGAYRPGCNSDDSNSLHLVAVDRETLALGANNLYCTGQDPAAFGAMTTDLSGITTESALIFIVSKGSPIPADWNFGTDGDARVYPLAQQIARLGGYWETMVYLKPNDTYSLVTAAPPPPDIGVIDTRRRAREASSVYPTNINGHAPSGELHGVLARGRGNWYSPLNSDPTGLANLDLYGFLAQKPVNFPHPVGTDEIGAFQTINSQLCGSTTCNVRNEYGNLNINISSTYETPLETTYGQTCNDPSNSNSPYCVVAAQLIDEFKKVSNIRSFYDNVTGLWSSSGTVTLASSLSAFDDVKATIPAPPAAPAPSLMSPLVNFFLGLGSLIPEVGPLLGLADVAFNFGTSLSTDKKGNPTIDLTSTIGQLEQQAAAQFIAQGNSTGTLFNFIYQDWGKINAVGTALASAQDSSSPWFWGTGTTSTILENMDSPIREAAYQNLMPAAYGIGRYFPDSATNQGWTWGVIPLTGQPYAYIVQVNENSPGVPVSHPFWLPAYSVYSNPTDFATSGFANNPGTGTILADGGWLAISALNTPKFGTNESFQYQPPDQSLLATLFQPVSQNGGLGVYRPDFFEGWSFPRVQCDQSFGNRGSYTSIGGCDWNSAKLGQPPPGNLIGGITMQAAQVASNGTEVDVRLTLFNSGTEALKSLDLTSVSLRTLGGSGQASVLSGAPLLIGDLAAGDTAAVTLKLQIPASVTKLSLTEQVSFDSGKPELTQASGGQVLYPKR
jgi:hypothetical protein